MKKITTIFTLAASVILLGSCQKESLPGITVTLPAIQGSSLGNGFPATGGVPSQTIDILLYSESSTDTLHVGKIVTCSKLIPPNGFTANDQTMEGAWSLAPDMPELELGKSKVVPSPNGFSTLYRKGTIQKIMN